MRVCARGDRAGPVYSEPVASFFTQLDGTTFAATAHTRGPWSADLMHAGPPTSLLSRVSTGALAAPGMRLGRISVEILAPVPVGEVAVRARTLRTGAQVALVEAELLADGRALMLARSWYLRRHPGLDVPGTASIPAPTAEGSVQSVAPGWSRGYIDAIEWRWVSGGLRESGPACVWARPLVDLVEGSPTTAVEHLLLIADSASGISAVADPSSLLFVNVDLTVYLRREPAPGPMWMDARTRVDRNGSGVASATIGDAEGDVARTEQLLYLQPRPPQPAPTA